MPSKQCCGTCAFHRPAENATAIDGFCHRLPPGSRMLENGQTQSFWGPVNLERGWCGEWKLGKKPVKKA